jgi:hypothetical protein
MVLSAFAGLFGACGSEPPPAGPDGAVLLDGGENAVRAEVGPQGVILTAPGGAVLEVPAGAVERRVTITVERLAPDATPALPNGYEAAGDAYALLPHGLRFASRVRIRIPFSGSSEDVAAFRLASSNDDQWTQLTSAGRRAGEIVVETARFSIYAPGRRGMDGGVGDGGPADGGAQDGGATDGGLTDAGFADGGLSDAATQDGGTGGGGASDAGTEHANSDGGSDSATRDAGTGDAGTGYASTE